jgi:hypothetical protein
MSAYATDPTLYDVLKASYAYSKHPNHNPLGKYGYHRDTELSNHNQQVYYNPIKNKIIYDIAGTHNVKDAVTDAYLALGHLKHTSRYKEAESTLEKAREKYHPRKVVGAGHSLGGSILGYLPVDKAYTLDKGATIGQSIGSHERAYRTSGDLVSVFNSTHSNMRTLTNPNKGIHTGNPFIDTVGNILTAHNVSNIKNKPIFV